jgi:glutamyl-tRNA reductase
VRTFTDIGRHSVSLESLAVRTAGDALGELTDRAIVVLGAGESGTLVARRLHALGASRLSIVSRSSEHAQALATAVGGTASGLADLSDALEAAEVVFACTSAPHPVLTRDFLAHRIAVRGDAPLLCVDLGMPRAIAHDVATLAAVRIVTLDDLTAAADAHRQARREHVPAAEAIVEAETSRFLSWLRERGAASQLAALDARVEELANAEVARALARLPGADDITKKVIAELGHRLARKLSHEPKQALKRGDLENVAHG